MKILGVIPARFASTRFPGKPLAMIGNQSMIQRVYFQTAKCKKLNHIIVATEDERIFNHVKSFSGNAMMTSANHQSGTDRCAEVISQLNENYDVVINIQGDEPFINPEQIDLLISCFENAKTEIATLIKTISDVNELGNIHIPKVVINKNGEALYFSRNIIPFDKTGKYLPEKKYFKHIGIYGYRADILKKISALKQSSLETAESLEQLRWLENGFSIQTAITKLENYPVDTPDDIKKIKSIIQF